MRRDAACRVRRAAGIQLVQPILRRLQISVRTILPAALLTLYLGLQASAERAQSHKEPDWRSKLESHSVSVRADAALALQRSRNVNAVPALLHALAREPVAAIRDREVAALVNTRSRAAIPGLVVLTRNGTAALRTQALFALGLLGDISVGAAVEARATDPDPSVRRAAAVAAGKLGFAHAEIMEKALINDKSGSVREGAIEACKALGSPVLCREIQAALRDKLAYVRLAAADTLGALKCRHAVGALCRVMANDKSPEVRYYSAAALAYLGDRRAIPVLTKAIVQGAPNMRAAAAYCLGAIGGKTAGTALVAALTDRNVMVRFRAAQALGVIQYHPAVSALSSLLRNPDNEDVHEQAAKALGRIGDSAGISALVFAFKDRDEAVPAAAALALGRIGDTRAWPYLRRLTTSPSQLVRRNAQIALQMLSKNRAAVR